MAEASGGRHWFWSHRQGHADDSTLRVELEGALPPAGGVSFSYVLFQLLYVVRGLLVCVIIYLFFLLLSLLLLFIINLFLPPLLLEFIFILFSSIKEVKS